MAIDGQTYDIKSLMPDYDINRLRLKPPSVFVTQSDEPGTYAVQTDGEWYDGMAEGEIVKELVKYRRALIKELRETEFYVRWLRNSGLFPLGEIKVKIEYIDKQSD